MDRLRLIRTFLAVAQARSFTTAAENLNMSRASVTKQVAALEASLRVALLNRTTHSVALTEAGLALAADGARLVDDFAALEERMRATGTELAGVVRIGTPPSFGAFHLVPAILEFRRAHPDIHVTLANDDGSLDIVRSGLDFTIRIAHSLRDTSAVSRLLTRAPQVLVAAPAYVAAHGAPSTPTDLTAHDCLVHSVKSPTGLWRFQHDGDVVRMRVSGRLSSNFGEAIRSAALLGAGIAMHPTYMVDDDVRAGRLEVLMPDYVPIGLEIRAVYARRDLPRRAALFLSFLNGWLKRHGRWLEPRPAR